MNRLLTGCLGARITFFLIWPTASNVTGGGDTTYFYFAKVCIYSHDA